MIECRTDCDSFEAKQFPGQCGSCQTDGHYLCPGCRWMASFEDMDLSDNRERYYPTQEKERRAIEEEQWQREQAQLFGDGHLDEVPHL